MNTGSSRVNKIIGAILNPAISSVDPDAIIERVDVDKMLTGVDLDLLITRVDIDDLLDRVDVNQLLDRVDVNRLLDRVDVKNLVQRAGIDEMIASATTGVAARTLDLARSQVVGLDAVIMRSIDRVCRRAPVHMSFETKDSQDYAAGPLAKLCGFLIDSTVVATLFSVVIFLGSTLIELFTSRTVSSSDGNPLLWGAAYMIWWFLYLWVNLMISGRTLGKAIVGIKVISTTGGELSARACAVRVLAFPLSLVLGIGFLPALLRPDRRAFHDLVAGTQEVIDWGFRNPTIPHTIARWLNPSVVG